MPALSAAPLLLALFTGTPVPTQPTSEFQEAVGPRHVEVTADTTGQEQEVGISPLLSTTFFFNAPLRPGGVVLEQRELFLMVVDEATGVITLLPSSRLPREGKLWLTVRFADGALPESVSFRLAVHPIRSESQVNVYRQTRSGESYQLQARQERERAERCEAELARTRATQERPGGLVGVLDEGLMVDELGVEARDISQSTIQRSDAALMARSTISYRAQGRVAMSLLMENRSAQPWRINREGIRMVSKAGVRLHVLHVWPLEPIPAGERLRVMVEADATEEQARGTYALVLGDVNRPRSVTLRGITFP